MMLTFEAPSSELSDSHGLSMLQKNAKIHFFSQSSFDTNFNFREMFPKIELKVLGNLTIGLENVGKESSKTDLIDLIEKIKNSNLDIFVICEQPFTKGIDDFIVKELQPYQIFTSKRVATVILQPTALHVGIYGIFASGACLTNTPKLY